MMPIGSRDIEDTAMPQDRLRILLIEHDAGFGRYISEMLGQTRTLVADVVLAEDLHRGIAALASGSFHVAVADLALPDGAGLANVAVLRGAAPHLPVILVGDLDDERLALHAIHAGAQEYIVKAQLAPAWLERSVRYAIEQQAMERALREAEASYRSVFDHLAEGIFRTNFEGRYLMANAALARIYGYASPEELRKNLTDIGHRLYVEPGRRDEFIRLMQEHDVLTRFESQVYRKDGSVIWISENCRAVRDQEGRLIYYEGTVEDISQRRQAEERLRHSEALYHSLVETLPQNILRKDLKGRFTFANQLFCKTLGRPLEEIIGKTDFDFFPAELAAKYQRDDLRVLESGEPFEATEEHQPPGRGKMYVQVVKTPLREADGRISGLQIIFWDITEQVMTDETIRQANIALALSQKELRLKNVQLEEDLKMAREIQLTMLPQQYPAFPRSGPDSGSAFQFTHRYLPEGTVGGDFFTVSALSETQAGVFLCDVAGHDVRSALVTAMIRALVEELKPLASSPGEFLTKLNSDLCAILRHTGSPMLTTGFYLVADWRTGTMQYANAGHPRPLHVRRAAGQVAELKNSLGKSQPAMGLIQEARYDSSEVQLAPGDLVLLFTDGLVEVLNPKEELYTQQMLVTAVEHRLKQPTQQMIDEVLDEIRRFSGAITFPDDVCLVGMDLTQD